MEPHFKAVIMEKQQLDYGMPEGLTLGFQAKENTDGTSIESLTIFGYEGNSDAAFYSGVSLAAQCQRLKVGIKENNELQKKEAIDKITKIVDAFHRMQLIHGKGLICRNVNGENVLGPDENILTTDYKTKDGKPLYWFGFLTFDQIISVMFGYYHTYMVKEHLPKTVYDLIKLDVDAIGEHFLKYNGFIGNQTNIRAYPWYVAFTWKHIHRIFSGNDISGRWSPDPNGKGFSRWIMNFFDKNVVLWLNFVVFRWLGLFGVYPTFKHIKYKLSILSTCYCITGKEKYKNGFLSTLKKYKDTIKKITKDGYLKTAADNKLVKTWMKLAYNVKQNGFWKFWSWFKKLPEHIVIDGSYLLTGVGTNLTFLSLFPIVDSLKEFKNKEDVSSYAILSGLMDLEYKRISYLNQPFFGYMALSSLTEFYHYVEQDRINIINVCNQSLLDFRGPRLQNSGILYTPHILTNTKISVLDYSGKVKYIYKYPVEMKYRSYHGFWPQSNAYEAETPSNSPQSQYNGYGSWLYSYWTARLNNWLK